MQAYEQVRQAISLLNEVARERREELAEAVGDGMQAEIAPEMFAQLLMAHLPIDRQMKASDKHFWLTVGEWMGPDWLHALAHATAFCRKSNEF